MAGREALGLSKRKILSIRRAVNLGRAAPDKAMPWRPLLSPPTRLDSNATLSMGLRPRLPAAAASPFEKEAGTSGVFSGANHQSRPHRSTRTPGQLSEKSTFLLAVSWVRGSCEAAVGVGNLARRPLQAILVELRSSGLV